LAESGGDVAELLLVHCKESIVSETTHIVPNEATGISPDAGNAGEVARLIHELLLALGVKAELLDVGRALQATKAPRVRPPGRQAISIARLCRRYLEHASSYYARKDGSISTEAKTIEAALRPLRELYARNPAADFGPRKLKLVREHMVTLGWCRRYINHQVGRIKQMFRWATENELVPPSVFQGIQTVTGLRAGRSGARESEPVRPVRDEMFDAILPLVSLQVKAMVRLQVLTGMRSGEVVIMRSCDIDQTIQPWLYRPFRHKTEHHGHERLVFLGPQAQEEIRPFLRQDAPEAFLFSAADAERERLRRLHEARVTPIAYGNRPGTNRKRRPKKQPGERYDVHSYRRAIKYACQRAFPVPDGLDETTLRSWRRSHSWHPHQLRHNAATRLRRDFGLDVAQVVLGHKTLAVTQVYAERDVESARRAIGAAG
jgi:integrase